MKRIFFALTFDYGQKARLKEIEAAKNIAQKYKIDHKVIELDYIKDIDTGLTKGKIPDFDGQKLDDFDYSTNTAKSVWVPNRNGIFINIAAAYADKFGVDYIITGFNKEEGTTFPDNTPEFIERINNSLEFSTLYHPVVLSYSIEMDKSGIVQFGKAIDAPFEFVWSCYYDGEKMCGKCESCQRLKRALNTNTFFNDFNQRNKWGIK